MRILLVMAIAVIAFVALGTILLALGELLFYLFTFTIKVLLVIALVLVIVRLLQGKRVF